MMRRRVCAVMRSLASPLSRRETVACETPASSAICLRVAMPLFSPSCVRAYGTDFIHTRTQWCAGTGHAVRLACARGACYIEKSGFVPVSLIIQKGPIGFDDDLFASVKRAENAESTRDVLCEQNKC